MENQASFDAFGLDPRISAGVRAAGYEKPTPIQQMTVAEAMSGRHVLGLAQTGTGKTAAFVLPILHRLLQGQGPEGQRHHGRGTRRTVRALIVAPTRELAEQIHDEFRRLGSHTGLKSATVYGGVGFQPQIDALKGRADIIVACPGRLLDHVQRGNADLSRVEVLVLDEADHMFDMGFLPPVRAILREVPADAQRLLFSATMPNEVRHLADELLTEPLVVEITRQAPAETIDHALIAVDEKVKTDLLLHMLRTQDHRSTLVFTRTKHRAKKLARTLDEANVFAAEIQGNLSQRRRQEALDGFKDGRYHVLVATDIAARGIDVARVSHVINFDFPDTPEAYTHRIGRTGRAERTGEALTFVTPNDFDNVRALERKLGMRVERKRFDGFAGPADELDELRPGTSGGRSGASSYRGGNGNRNSGRSGSRNGGGGRSRSGGGQRSGQPSGQGGGRSGGGRPGGHGTHAGGRSGNPSDGTPARPAAGHPSGDRPGSDRPGGGNASRNPRRRRGEGRPRHARQD